MIPVALIWSQCSAVQGDGGMNVME